MEGREGENQKRKFRYLVSFKKKVPMAKLREQAFKRRKVQGKGEELGTTLTNAFSSKS